MSRPGVRCWAYVWPVFLSSPGEGGAGLLASSSKAQRHSLSESALGHRSLLNQAPRPGRMCRLAKGSFITSGPGERSQPPCTHLDVL